MAAAAVSPTQAWAERGCSMRFVVTEIEGYSGLSHARSRGISCMVVDTLWNRRVVATFRSEDRGGSVEKRFATTRFEAQMKADVLNDPTITTRVCGHPKTTENTYFTSYGKSRGCRICQMQRMRERREAA